MPAPGRPTEAGLREVVEGELVRLWFSQGIPSAAA
jgi:hypothetical protein